MKNVIKSHNPEIDSVSDEMIADFIKKMTMKQGITDKLRQRNKRNVKLAVIREKLSVYFLYAQRL